MGRRHFFMTFLTPTMWLFFCKSCTFDLSTQSLYIWLGFVNVVVGDMKTAGNYKIDTYHNLNCYWNYLSPVHHEMQCQIAFPKHLHFCFSMAYQDILLLLCYSEIITTHSWVLNISLAIVGALHLSAEPFTRSNRCNSIWIGISIICRSFETVYGSQNTLKMPICSMGLKSMSTMCCRTYSQRKCSYICFEVNCASHENLPTKEMVGL